MNEFSATLKEKKGPLPVWAWLLLFIGLLAFYLFERKKKAAAAAAAAAEDQNSQGAPATNLGSNSLSNLVPQAYPMPFQQGDVFTNITVPPPSTTGTVTTTPTPPKSTPKPPAKTGPKYPNQIHAVGQVGKGYDLMSYIAGIYPNATPQERAEIGYATIADPKNKQYNLGSGIIPGGALVEFYSQAIK